MTQPDPRTADIEAEQGLISFCLCRPSAFEDARVLRVDDFYHQFHPAVWDAMGAAADNGALDTFSVRQQLRRAGKFNPDIDQYLKSISKPTGSLSVTEYVAAVSDRSLRRRLTTIANANLARANDFTITGAQAVDQGQAAMMEITASGGFGKVRQSLADVESVAWEQMALNASGARRGLKIGFEIFDTRTRGLRPGNLVAVVGRSGMGKTALAVKLADYAAIDQFRHVAIFEAEMLAVDLYMRMLSSRSQLTQLELEGYLSKSDHTTAKDAAEMLHSNRIQIIDTVAAKSGITPSLIRSECRAMKREQGLDMIIVDYLELMVTDTKIDNEVQRLDSLIRSLKAIAMEFGCVVVVLCQMKEASNSRENKRPILSDIRGSGGIAAALDWAFGIYNLNYYARQESPDKFAHDPDMRQPDEVEINTLKSRNDVPVAIKAGFIPAFTHFYDLGIPDPNAPTGV